MEQALLVFTNMPNAESALLLAHRLVEQKLAACVNILPAVHSIYRWQGTITESEEITLLIKTAQSRYAELETAIKAMHPYALPEIMAIPVSAGLPAYLDWIAQETRKDMHV